MMSKFEQFMEEIRNSCDEVCQSQESCRENSSTYIVSYLSSGKGIPRAGSEDIKVLLPVATEGARKAIQL